MLKYLQEIDSLRLQETSERPEMLGKDPPRAVFYIDLNSPNLNLDQDLQVQRWEFAVQWVHVTEIRELN